MKKILEILNWRIYILFCLVFVSCNDFLDREPLSKISPESYFNDESQLFSYANGLYSKILISHSNAGSGYGTFGIDKHTDMMASTSYDSRYVPGQWKVPQNGGNWDFSNIYNCNYFFKEVLPKYREGKINGSTSNIRQCIGEIYFLRAYEYFKKLQEFGDFPIIKEALPDDKNILTEASKRFPRNEVARFIIEDLDSAANALQEYPDSKRNRISRKCALLLKSRVALFEGTWLKYFKGTAFVPGGNGWPGISKIDGDYNYPSGNIDEEINYFLSLAMEASMEVADNVDLVINNGILQQTASDAVNPYFDMFSSEDMSIYDEVLLWRQYDKGLGITHGVVQYAQRSNADVGVTRSFVNSFLMKDGKPYYDSQSYMGDQLISTVRDNRDGRLWLFLKEPNQINIIYNSDENTHGTLIEPIPDITNGSAGLKYITGYTLRKGLNYNGKHCGNFLGYTGSIIFRAVEAYLNYIEACYEKTGGLDEKAADYWMKIRQRANLDIDFYKTINSTDMQKEAEFNWAAYSGGKIIDPLLFNIRRERSCELMAEGFRYMDLLRWRSMDQMINTPFHVEGFNLWDEMYKYYDNPDGGTKLVYGLDNPQSNVSSPNLSKYLRPYELNSKSLVLDGYKWNMTHYLSPIPIQQFLITSPDNNPENSVIYQNPGWPLEANKGPLN